MIHIGFIYNPALVSHIRQEPDAGLSYCCKQKGGENSEKEILLQANSLHFVFGAAEPEPNVWVRILYQSQTSIFFKYIKKGSGMTAGG